VPNGTISSITPTSGQYATRITMAGSSLLGGGSAFAAVFIGGVAATIISGNDTRVVAVLARNAQSGASAVRLVADTGARVSGTGSGVFTYLAEGVISSVVPSSGQEGTLVTLQGQRLLGGGSSLSTVTLGGVTARILSATDTFVIVEAAAGAAGANLTVLLVANTGAEVALAASWTYLAAGVLQGVQPTSGQFGTSVTLTGHGLRGGGAHVVGVTLAGVAVSSITSENDVQVVVVAAHSGATTGQVIITSDSGAIVYGLSFAYGAPGVVSSIVPSSGQFGTLVTIAGSNLLGHGLSLAQVFLGGVEASIVSVNGDATAVVVSAPHAAAAFGGVTLVANTGAVVSNVTGWQFLAEGVVSSVTPSSGRVGTLVTIAGSRLLGDGFLLTGVTLAGVPVLQVVSFTDTAVVVVAGDGAASTGDVVLTSETGSQVTSTNGWRYTFYALSLMEPVVGVEGTIVRLHGTGFFGGDTGVSSVTLAGVPAVILPPVLDLFLNVRASVGAAGLSGVVVITSNRGAIAQTPFNFTYLTPGVLTAVTPSSGQVGSLVTINGTGLLSGGSSLAAVYLAQVPARIVSASDSVVVVEAASSLPKVGDVLLQANTGGVARLVNGWQYLSAGRITSIEPASGQFGTRVTLRGLNLLAGGSSLASVQLGGFSVGSIVSQTNTMVVVVAGDHPASVGDVLLTSDSNGVVLASNEWTYLSRGAISAASPSFGQGGTIVTVTGQRLLGGGAAVVAATLAGVAAQVLSSNDTAVVVRAGVFANSSVGAIVLTADTGAVVERASFWTYATPGAIAAVTPAFGQGGTRVVVSGLGLRGSGQHVVEVTLHGAVAGQIVFENDTHVEVVAGATTLAGLGDVVLTANTGAQVVAPASWTGLVEAVITGVFPASGQVGTRVTVTGARLLGGGVAVTAAWLGGVAAQVVSSNNSQVVLVVRQRGAGAVDVVLEADTGARVVGVLAFTYLVEGSVTTVQPSSGQYGTRVTLTGQRLLGGGAVVTGVTLAGVAVAAVSSASDTEIVVVAQHANATAGAQDVVITTDTGAKTTASSAWAYIPRGAIASVSPTSGQFSTLIVVNGSGLLGGGSSLVSVYFGNVQGTVLSFSDLTVTVRAPSHASGLVDVVLEANTGALLSSASSFTFTPVGTVLSISPSIGQVGTVVTIQGTNLQGDGGVVTSVTLAGVTVASIMSQNATQVVVVAGLSARVSGIVVLTAQSGAVVSSFDNFSFVDLRDRSDLV
jgi:hypothetical protein